MKKIKNKRCHRLPAVWVLLALNRATTPVSAFNLSGIPRRSLGEALVSSHRSLRLQATEANTERERRTDRAVLGSSRRSLKLHSSTEGNAEQERRNSFRGIGLDAPNVQAVLGSLGLAVALLFSAPLDANAGFGPSRAATTSPPPNLVRPNIQSEDVITNGKKLKQQIGSTLDENRLRDFSSQLDDLTNYLNNLINQEEKVEETLDDLPLEATKNALKERVAELEKARLLQQQIADREKLLTQLEAQPDWFNYFAAAIGSVVSTLIMHPIDTIKVRLITRKDEDEGIGDISSLYEGLTGNLLKEAPPSALYLGVYESVKYALLNQFGVDYRLLIYLASGAAGELVGSIIRAPAEAIKSTVQSGNAGSAPEAVQKVFSEKGRQNIFNAWSASVWRDVPFGGIQLAIFELIKSFILNSPDIDFDSSTLLSEAIIGAFAGGVGALVTNPFDIITTRIITQTPNEEEGEEPLGIIGMGRRVYEEGGFQAFAVGWGARGEQS